jgi:tetratricopeptide (TPR) repeat protein
MNDNAVFETEVVSTRWAARSAAEKDVVDGDLARIRVGEVETHYRPIQQGRVVWGSDEEISELASRGAFVEGLALKGAAAAVREAAKKGGHEAMRWVAAHVDERNSPQEGGSLQRWHARRDQKGEPRAALLIHGVLSSPDGAFGAMVENGAISTLTDAESGHDVWRYGHRTLTKSPIQNALDLARLIAAEAQGAREPWTNTTLLVHSRGGLVAELLALATHQPKRSASALSREERKHWKALVAEAKTLQASGFNIRRIVRVGSPMGGSALAGSRARRVLEALLALAKWTARIGGPTGIGEVVTLLEGFLVGMAGAAWDGSEVAPIPGLACMAPGSRLLQFIEGPSIDVQTIALGAAWKASDVWNAGLTWLGRWGLDALHSGPNDIAVHTASMAACRRPNAFLTRVGPRRGVHHLNYFSYAGPRRGIDEVLAAVQAGLEPSPAASLEASVESWLDRFDVNRSGSSPSPRRSLELRLSKPFFEADATTPDGLSAAGREWYEDLRESLAQLGWHARVGERVTGGGANDDARLEVRGPEQGVLRLAAASTSPSANAVTLESLAPEHLAEAVATWASRGGDCVLQPLRAVPVGGAAPESAEPQRPQQRLHELAFNAPLPRPAASTIQVQHGSPHAFDGGLLLLPVYAGEAESAVLARLDDRAGAGELGRLARNGAMPRPGEVVEVAHRRGGRETQVALLGLSTPDQASPSELADTVARALVRRLSVDPYQPLAVGAVLLGQAGYEAIRTEECLAAVVTGIRRALAETRVSRRFTLLVYERYQDLAIRAAHAAEALALEAKLEHLPLREVNGFYGARPTAPTERSSWVKIEAHTEDASQLRVTIADRAATTTLSTPTQWRDEYRTPVLSATVAQAIAKHEQLLLLVDASTAGHAWELADIDRNAGTAPLGLERAVVRVFHETAGTTHASPTVADRTALVLGDPTDTGKVPLPGSRREARAVASALRDAGYAVEESIGGDGRASVGSIARRPFAILHLATHGLSTDGGKVLLGGGHALDLAGVETMRHVPAMVVLSACDVGVPSSATRELTAATETLARAFLRRGTRIFVAGAWRVNDGAACCFMEELYRRLLGGMPLGQALLHARRSTSKLGGETWAAFHAYGDPEARLRHGQVGVSAGDAGRRFMHGQEVRAAAITLLGDAQLARPSERAALRQRAEKLYETLETEAGLLDVDEAYERVGAALAQLGSVDKAIAALNRGASGGRARADALIRSLAMQARRAWVGGEQAEHEQHREALGALTRGLKAALPEPDGQAVVALARATASLEEVRWLATWSGVEDKRAAAREAVAKLDPKPSKVASTRASFVLGETPAVGSSSSSRAGSAGWSETQILHALATLSNEALGKPDVLASTGLSPRADLQAATLYADLLWLRAALADAAERERCERALGALQAAFSDGSGHPIPLPPL